MAGILLNRSRQVPAEETPAFGGIAERFRRGGDLDRAIALCRDGLKRFPEQLSARVTLGWALLDKGQYDAARAELEQVLRKAPDNLAAIRGLAELHDRTEGAIAAEDERSWRSEDAAASAAAESSAAAAAAAASPAPDGLSPVQASSGPAAAEILQTAAQAEQVAEAAAADLGAAALSLGPVELEDAAAASMAAAEPSPFFVVAPSDALAFEPDLAVDQTAPVPFEVHTPSAVVEAVEIETPEAAALSAAMMGGLDLEVDTSAPAALFDDGDVAELTALAREAGGIDDAGPAFEAASLEPTSPWQVEGQAEGDDASELLASSGLSDGVLAGDADVVLEPLFSVEAAEQAFDVAAFTAPEGLDDIDELAGQELAEAIRALEEAAKRVEAHLAPQPLGTEPATAPEDIASYDFGPDPELTADSSHDGLALLETPQDGSFELVAPDLSDLSFTLETSDAQDDANEDVSEPVAAGGSSPAFDFEALDTDGSAAEGAGTVEAVDLPADEPAAGLEASADLVDAVAGVAEPTDLDQVFADGEPDETPDAAADLMADPVAVAETAEQAIAVGASSTADDAMLVIEEDSSSDVDALGADVVASLDGTEITAGATDDCVQAGDAAHVGEPAEDIVDVAAQTPDAAEDVAPAPEAGVLDVEPSEEESLSPAAFENTDRSESTVLVSEPAGDEHTAVQTSNAPAFEPQPEAAEPSFVPPVDLTPVVHVYDAPVFVASAESAVVAEVAALVARDEPVSLPAIGQVQTPVRAQLAALERFLRKVQARRLELRGETVA